MFTTKLHHNWVEYAWGECPPPEIVLFDYDFTGSSTVWQDLIWYTASYWFDKTDNWLRTYNMSRNDRWWHAGKVIAENLEWKKVTMDATFLSTFWSTRTWIWCWFTDWQPWNNTATNNSLTIELNTTYYSSYTTYDGLLAPRVTYNWNTYDNLISWYWRTIATSWNHIIRYLVNYNFVNWSIEYTIYSDWVEHKTGTYNFNNNQIAWAKNAIKNWAYYWTEFGRWYTSVDNFLQKWKVTIIP